MPKIKKYRIEIHFISGHPIAYLKRCFLFCIWVKEKEYWLWTDKDFMIVERWMKKYNLTAKQVKQKQAA